jgi:hypothetical protein
LGACGSDDDSSAGAESTTAATRPEDHKADDATVTRGLTAMTESATKIATEVAGGTKIADAKDQLEADWKEVEGTFKDNEPDLYLSVEEAIGGIGKAAGEGNSADTARFAADLGKAISDYLAKHP